MLAAHSFDHAYNPDAGQHILGQRYFLADHWRWPLLRAIGLGAPKGTNIALTDSIPLVALPLKLFARWLPAGFHGIYLWLALSYVMQPVAAVYALRGTGERRAGMSAGVAILAISMPILWSRAMHVALSSHFLILIALGLYLRLCGGGARRIHAAEAAMLMPVVLLVNPYLMVMVAAVLGAAPVSLLVRRDGFWRVAATGAGVGLVVTAALAALLGYMAAIPGDGFGEFSMNVLAPFYPDRSGLFPGVSLPYGNWRQADGYNYLGAGVIMLALIGVASLLNRRGLHVLTHHAGLVACCVALTFLAFSNRCFAGPILLYDLEPVPRMIAQFRGTGRFFWPVAYCILLFGFVATARSVQRRAVAPVLLAACALQFVDAGKVRAFAWGEVNQPPAWLLDAAALRPVLAHHRLLRVFPLYQCGFDATFYQLAQLASEHALPVNTAYVARLERQVHCGDTDNGPLQPGELRAFELFDADAAAKVPGAAEYCRRSPGVILCTLSRADLDAVAVGGGAPALTLEGGWCAPDAGGVWSCAEEARLLIALKTPGARSLVLSGLAIAAAAGQTQDVDVSLNGQVLTRLALADRQGFRVAVTLPPALDLRGPLALSSELAIRLRQCSAGSMAIQGRWDCSFPRSNSLAGRGW